MKSLLLLFLARALPWRPRWEAVDRRGGALARIGTRFRSTLLLVAAGHGWACSGGTPPAAAHDSPGQRSVERRPEIQHVRDPQGRFELELRSWSPVKVDVLPGYVQVTAEVVVNRKLHCFVFETPVDAGAAMSRALDSLATGAELRVTELPELGQIRGQPLVDWELDYLSTMPPAHSGRVLTLLLASSEYPMLCSYDAPSELAIGRREAKRGMSSFRRLCKGGVPCPLPSREFELWRVDGASHRGFLLHERVQDGEARLSYSRSASFEVQGESVTTLDQLSVERSDSRGLALGRWVGLRDGRAQFRAQLERQDAPPSEAGGTHGEDASSLRAKSGATDARDRAAASEHSEPEREPGSAALHYRYGVERGLERAQGFFSSEVPLSDSVQFSWELLEAELPSESRLYAPLLHPASATEVELRSRSAGARVRVWHGEKAERCSLVSRTPAGEPFWRSLENCELLRAPSLDGSELTYEVEAALLASSRGQGTAEDGDSDAPPGDVSSAEPSR